MDKKRIIQVDEKVPLPMLLPLSIQHVFAMFGASVLVPILFQIDSGIVLFMNGFGTLLFIFLTKGKAPAYLGSSFAFLAPAGGVIAALGYMRRARRSGKGCCGNCSQCSGCRRN